MPAAPPATAGFAGLVGVWVGSAAYGVDQLESAKPYNSATTHWSDPPGVANWAEGAARYPREVGR